MSCPRHVPKQSSSCQRLAFAPRACALAALLIASAGCQVWPFRDNERTSIITPAMRAASIREMGLRAEDATDAEQLAMCEELAQQIRTEPDPLVRRAIQEAAAEFQAPLSSAILVAGLNDEDRGVRTTCCRLLGRRRDPAGVTPLSRIVAAEADAEVRMAAIDALGKYKSRDAVVALAAAVKDRDPAMQYAGVQAMKNASGENLGNDVADWRAYAEQLAPVQSPSGTEINVAQQPDDAGVR